MQTQVAEYKQLKDTLNRIPSFRKAEQTEQQNITQAAHSPQGDSAARDKSPGEAREVRAWEPACGRAVFSVKLFSGELL